MRHVPFWLLSMQQVFRNTHPKYKGNMNRHHNSHLLVAFLVLAVVVS